MSTEGFISFIANGERKDIYNNSDSYPSWLGVRVLQWLRVARDGGLPEAVNRLRVVDDFGPNKTEPTDADRTALAAYACDRVGGPDDHWYRLTRELQGDPAAILAAGVAYGGDEPYGYVYAIDADAQTFSVEGRTWAWSALPTDDEFLAQLGELWRPVGGYPGLYEVSSFARVRSLPRRGTRRNRSYGGQILTPSRMGNGYYGVKLSKGNVKRTHTLHELVCAAFHEKPGPEYEVRHLEGNWSDCRAVAVAWGTHADNERDRVEHGTHNRAHRICCDNVDMGRRCMRCEKMRQTP